MRPQTPMNTMYITPENLSPRREIQQIPFVYVRLNTYNWFHIEVFRYARYKFAIKYEISEIQHSWNPIWPTKWLTTSPVTDIMTNVDRVVYLLICHKSQIYDEKHWKVDNCWYEECSTMKILQRTTVHITERKWTDQV